MTLSLERAWAVLSPPRSDGLESFPLDLTFAGVPCRVALDAAGGRHLLVPTGDETVAADSKVSVLGLHVRKLGFGGSVHVYVDVSCADTDLFDEFDDVVDDVLDEIEETDRPAATTAATVARWRKLFAGKLIRGMSKPAKLGLFAELTLLNQFVDADPSFSVEAWRGPLREPHDFEAPVRCVEVKALGLMAGTVVIHGIDQLGMHDGRPLDLVLVRVVEDPDGATIGDLVADLRDSNIPPGALRSRLAATGWAESPDRPDPDHFAIQDVLRVPVGPEVPRIVRSSLLDGALPEGTHDLTYHLDLDVLLPLATSASLAQVAEEAIR